MSKSRNSHSDLPPNRTQVLVGILALVGVLGGAIIAGLSPIIQDGFRFSREQSMTETAMVRTTTAASAIPTLLSTHVSQPIPTVGQRIIASPSASSDTLLLNNTTLRCWGIYGQPSFAIYPVLTETFASHSTALLPVPSLLTENIENSALHPQLRRGDLLNVIGKVANENQIWLFVEIAPEGQANQQGFVLVQLTTFGGDVEALPSVIFPLC